MKNLYLIPFDPNDYYYRQEQFEWESQRWHDHMDWTSSDELTQGEVKS